MSVLVDVVLVENLADIRILAERLDCLLEIHPHPPRRFADRQSDLVDAESGHVAQTESALQKENLPERQGSVHGLVELFLTVGKEDRNKLRLRDAVEKNF
jgi:hypothetical protein